MGEEQQFGKHLRFIPEKRRADDTFGGCALVYLWSMLEEVGVLVAGAQVVEKDGGSLGSDSLTWRKEDGKGGDIKG